MIGLILTGHGEFAIGVGHALEMIAGKQTAYKVVPFLESDCSICRPFRRKSFQISNGCINGFR